MKSENAIMLIALVFAVFWIVTQLEKSNLQQEVYNLNGRIAEQNRRWEAQAQRMSSEDFNDFVHVYSLYLRAKERAAHGRSEDVRKKGIRESIATVRRDSKVHDEDQSKSAKTLGKDPAARD